jgi:hypothetical protein
MSLPLPDQVSMDNSLNGGGSLTDTNPETWRGTVTGVTEPYQDTVSARGTVMRLEATWRTSMVTPELWNVPPPRMGQSSQLMPGSCRRTARRQPRLRPLDTIVVST